MSPSMIAAPLEPVHRPYSGPMGFLVGTGHADLSTTQRYMHLSPRAVNDAVRMLEDAHADQGRGAIVERAPEGRNLGSG